VVDFITGIYYVVCTVRLCVVSKDCQKYRSKDTSSGKKKKDLNRLDRCLISPSHVGNPSFTQNTEHPI
jgi:hypothetical protein